MSYGDNCSQASDVAEPYFRLCLDFSNETIKGGLVYSSHANGGSHAASYGITGNLPDILWHQQCRTPGTGEHRELSRCIVLQMFEEPKT